MTVQDIIQRLYQLAPFNKRDHYPYNLKIKLGPIRLLSKELANANVDWSDFAYNIHYDLTLVYGLSMAYSQRSLEEKWIFYRAYFKDATDWSFVDGVAVTLPKNIGEEVIKVIPEFAKSSFPYLRRFAYVLALIYVVPKKPLDIVWSLIDEQEAVYHVYMAIAWLLAECFIRRKSEFLEYISQSHLAIWIRQKMVSKIRDSYRVSREDKEFVKELRGN